MGVASDEWHTPVAADCDGSEVMREGQKTGTDDSWPTEDGWLPGPVLHGLVAGWT